MIDQAESLRRLVDQKSPKEAKVIAVVSGKGGVGKSNVSLNFAISLAKLGKRVALFDLDIGMANIDILMGVTPTYHIMDLLNEQLTIWDIIEEGTEGIAYIAGGSGFSKLVELDHTKMERFFQQLEQLGPHFDYIIMDMGAGATKTSIQFVLASHEVFVVTTPEPPAITDAYAMMKHLIIQDKEKPFYLIVNRAESKAEGERVLNSLVKVALQFLGKDVRKLGSIPFDQTVTKAVKAQKPFILLDKNAQASRAVFQLTSLYIGESKQRPSRFGSFVSKMRHLFKND